VGPLARVPGYVAEVAELRAFLDAGLFADPPAAGLGEEIFALDAQEYLEAVAVDLTADHWSGEAIAHAAGTEPVSADLGRNAAYEVLAATAAGVAHEETGAIVVDRAVAEEAARRASAFVAGEGFGALVRVFCTCVAFEDLQAVDFHNPMPEPTFVAGLSHRPWSAYALQDDLLMAVAAGTLRLSLTGSRERQVWTTPHGRAVLAELRERLGAAGILTRRRRQLAVSHGNWLALEPEWSPAAARREAWDDLLAAAGVGPGSRVLVLGLAAGGDAFLSELRLRVGTEGEVLVVDPAVAVLRHFSHHNGGSRSTGAAGHDGAAPAAVAALAGAAPAIRLLPGRFEALPLSDGAVDAALAPAFLHVAEHEPALVELRRVVKSGGRVVLGVPHAVDAGQALLREWLEPLLDLAARLEVPSPVAGHAAHQAGLALQRHGFVGLEVRPHGFPWTAGNVRGALLHVVHGSELGRQVLERTPWRQRRDLLHDLLARGERLLADADAAGRALVAPGELVLATVP